MKTLTMKSLLTSGLVLAGGAAMAQAVPFGQIDTDGDGMLSQAELVAVFGEDGAMTVMADDADGDGMVSMAEVRVGANMSEGMGDMDDMGTTEMDALNDGDGDGMNEADMEADDDDDGSAGASDEDSGDSDGDGN